MNIGIEKIVTYLPEGKMSVHQFYEKMKKNYDYSISDEEIERFIETSKYNEVVYEENLNRIELLDAFFQKLMDYYNGDEIDYILYSTDIPEATRDKVVYQLYYIHKYKFTNANYMTLNQQCGTQINAIAIATSLIRCKQAKRVLIVSHSFKDELRRRLLEGYGIIGDGVVGIIVSEDASQMTYVDSYTKTNGEYYDLNKTPKAGMSYFQYLHNGVDNINEILHRNNLLISDIKIIIPQNVSAMEWDFYAPRLKCKPDQIYLKNVSRYGHLGDADAFINLNDAINDISMEKGDYILLQSVGAGATFNSLLLRY